MKSNDTSVVWKMKMLFCSRVNFIFGVAVLFTKKKKKNNPRLIGGAVFFTMWGGE